MHTESEDLQNHLLSLSTADTLIFFHCVETNVCKILSDDISCMIKSIENETIIQYFLSWLEMPILVLLLAASYVVVVDDSDFSWVDWNTSTLGSNNNLTCNDFTPGLNTVYPETFICQNFNKCHIHV